jgi:hypothetical protein
MLKRYKERHTKMTYTEPVLPVFHEGDEVELAEGTYQGTLGVFVRLTDDAGWADITERNGAVRSHPVAWLRHNVKLPSRPSSPPWDLKSREVLVPRHSSLP